MANIRMGRIVLVGAEPPETLFDWQEQWEDADDIIAALKKPRPTGIGSRRKKPSPGLDLGKHRDCLAKFLAEFGEGFVLACQDFEMRNDPDRPHRELEKNWKYDEPDPPYDYGDDFGLGLDFDWEVFWDETYVRDRGNSGGNRTATKRSDPRPAIEPLRMNYPAIEAWWKRTTGKKFSPKFAKRATSEMEAEPFDRNNHAARFLILVMQCLSNRYDPANARGLADTVKRKRRKERNGGRKNKLHQG